MKGLKEYIRKHGRHFTEELAYDAALSRKWNKKQVEDAIQKKVWYNVTGSTIGDIIYLVNECYDDENTFGYGRKNRCINYTLAFVGDYRNHGGVLFMKWLTEIMQCSVAKDNFDFTPYL